MAAGQKAEADLLDKIQETVDLLYTRVQSLNSTQHETAAQLDLAAKAMNQSLQEQLVLSKELKAMGKTVSRLTMWQMEHDTGGSEDKGDRARPSGSACGFPRHPRPPDHNSTDRDTQDFLGGFFDAVGQSHLSYTQIGAGPVVLRVPDRKCVQDDCTLFRDWDCDRRHIGYDNVRRFMDDNSSATLAADCCPDGGNNGSCGGGVVSEAAHELFDKMPQKKVVWDEMLPDCKLHVGLLQQVATGAAHWFDEEIEPITKFSDSDKLPHGSGILVRTELSMDVVVPVFDGMPINDVKWDDMPTNENIHHGLLQQIALGSEGILDGVSYNTTVIWDEEILHDLDSQSGLLWQLAQGDESMAIGDQKSIVSPDCCVKLTQASCVQRDLVMDPVHMNDRSFEGMLAGCLGDTKGLVCERKTNEMKLSIFPVLHVDVLDDYGLQGWSLEQVIGCAEYLVNEKTKSTIKLEADDKFLHVFDIFGMPLEDKQIVADSTEFMLSGLWTTTAHYDFDEMFIKIQRVEKQVLLDHAHNELLQQTAMGKGFLIGENFCHAKLKLCVVQAPGFGDNSRANLSDIVVILREQHYEQLGIYKQAGFSLRTLDPGQAHATFEHAMRWPYLQFLLFAVWLETTMEQERWFPWDPGGAWGQAPFLGAGNVTHGPCATMGHNTAVYKPTTAHVGGMSTRGEQSNEKALNRKSQKLESGSSPSFRRRPCRSGLSVYRRRPHVPAHHRRPRGVTLLIPL